MTRIWADLHLHSTFSDGSLSPRQIAELASHLHIHAISITDHDTLAGQAEALAAGREYGIKIITGIEISARSRQLDRKVHILGYGVRDTQRVEAACLPYLLSRHKASLKRIALLRKAGYPIDVDIVLGYTGKSRIIYRQHIMHALIDRGYGSSIYGLLYNRCFGKGGIAVVESDCIEACDAVGLVKDAGGLAVLAHPFSYGSMELLPKLKAAGLDGIEYSHPSNDTQRQQDIMDAATQLGLFLTGGSDAHGLYTEGPCLPGSFGIVLDQEHRLLEITQ